MATPMGPSRIPKPLHPFFVGLGGALLMAALFTDFMYSSNSLMQWANFSAWLITGGLILALISAIVLIIDFALGWVGPIRWLDFGLLAAAAVLSIFNVFIHTRDAWTSVVPSGITISAIVTILLAVAGLRGWCVTAIPFAGRGDVA
ncbi:DUF2231 domain-containing protein [Sphingomonas sp. PR090111-T3T-6A]|uniref:DUF2231 domain-containing protein n=1 Tax=Sphingomonas sp. PR090111-T3T-6A TaxID=685778 RepID=UPI0003A02F64|nr:DUF2231 domain-containing protein [Sphingomonas sp. PR090111-T3T-6A]